MWNRISPTISINKDITVISWSQASKCEWGLPKENTMPAIQQLPPTLTVIAEELVVGGCEKSKRQDTGPSWDVYERNDFDNPRLLHFPIHRRVLNSLRYHIWFSIINSNLLMFQPPGHLLQKKNPIYPGSPPLPLQNSFLKIIWKSAEWNKTLSF